MEIYSKVSLMPW